VVVSFVWEAPPGENGQVEFVVDIVARDEDPAAGVLEQPPTQEPTATTTKPTLAGEDPTEDPAESDGPPVTAFLAVLVVLLAGLAAYVLYRRRASRGDHQ
jgi:hypothetical protein